MQENPEVSPQQVAESREQVKGRIDAESRDFLTRLTDSWDIDDDLENLFWGYASKDMVLTNFREEDVEIMMEGFQDTLDDYIIQQPEHEYTWEEQLAIGQFEDWLRARLRRSIDGFERKMETTETSISRNVVEGGRGEESSGMIDRLRGFFGKKPTPEEQTSGPMEVPR